MKTRKKRWTESRVERLLANVLTIVLEKRGGGDVRTFEDAAILTSNKGLVVKTPDGSEFQLTIVDSTRG